MISPYKFKDSSSMPSDSQSPHKKPPRLRFLSSIFCGAALMLGLAGCDRKPEEPQRQQQTTMAEPVPPPDTEPASPTSPKPAAPAACVDYRLGIPHQSRSLTAGEMQLAKGLFGDRLDTRCIRLDFLPANKKAGMEVAADEKYNIEFAGKTYASADYSREGREKFAVFVEGLTWLWQNQTNGSETRGTPDEKYYPLDSQYSFDAYGDEQQAEIMQDYALRFLHPSRRSLYLPHEYGGDRSDTDPFLQALVENYFPSAQAARESYANIETREMTPGEAAVIRSIFGFMLNQDGVSLNFHPEKLTDAVGTTSSAAGADFWGKDQRSNDFSREKSAELFGTFVHEVTHVWQYQTKWLYTVTGDEEQDDNDPLADYKYPLAKKWKFTDYGVEQQAAIVEDYARRFLHPAHELYYLPLVYGAEGARAKEGLLMKVVEDQFPAAKQARLAFAQKEAGQQTAPPAKIRYRVAGAAPSP
jgi:uncharacterized protein YukJ